MLTRPRERLPRHRLATVSEIVGEEPTAEDNYWLTVASNDLSPDKSLQRISDKVGFIFTNLALAGTILAGAGIVAGVQARTRAHPLLLLILVILVFASVATALIANLPSTKTEINASDPEAIRQYYERTIRWKGWFARTGMLLFSAALILAFILVISVADPGPTARLSMQWTSSGAGRSAELHATVQASGLSGTSVGKTTLTAFRPDGRRMVLSRGISKVGADGTMTLSTDIKIATFFSSVMLSVTVIRDHRTVESRSMKLSV
jgi:hypothetical protein